jgi:hypothetical protein
MMMRDCGWGEIKTPGWRTFVTTKSILAQTLLVVPNYLFNSLVLYTWCHPDIMALLVLPTGILNPILIIMISVVCCILIYIITRSVSPVDEASVNKIIEETRRSSITRSPPDGSTSNTFELESPRAVAEITQRALHDKAKDYDEEQVITDEDGGETRVRRTHKEEKGDTGSRSFTRTAAVSKRSEPGREERTYTAVTTVTQQKSTIGTPSPGKPEHSIARVGRSGSVKALQQRFQQAAGTILLRCALLYLECVDM